jgi:hypothetical protein
VWHAIHASTTTANIWNGPEKERAYSPNATRRKTTTEKPLFLFVFFWVRIQQEIDGFNSFPSKDRRLYRPPTSTTDQTKVKTPAREAVMEPPCADTGTHQMGWHMLLPHGQGHGRTHQMEMGWHMLLAHGQGPSSLLHPGLGCFAASPVPHHRSPLMEEGRGHPTTTSSRRQPRHFP